MTQDMTTHEAAMESLNPQAAMLNAWALEISDKIYEAMRNRHLSIKAAAKMLGTAEETVKSWLDGTNDFTLSELAYVSAALNVELIKADF